MSSSSSTQAAGSEAEATIASTAATDAKPTTSEAKETSTVDGAGVVPAGADGAVPAADGAVPAADGAVPAADVAPAAEVRVDNFPWRKAKKVAVMLSFSGKKYMGMQRNPGFPTIEEEILKALKSTGAIAPEWFDNQQKAYFQRASRTDKGVSAAKMIISLRMLHDSSTIDKVNGALPCDVKLQALRRVTKNFNSKNACDGRTYLYLLPTFAFCPVEQTMSEQYRIDQAQRDNVNETLKSFVGVHYFHNYTSGKLPMEPSSQRYITSFTMGEPFIRDGLEFAIIEVKGQSFMLHQIRKMIGMMIAVVRGHASMAVLEQTWQLERIDVPKAPGLGLMLEEVHYDKYNKRFGKDGIHEPLEWSSVADDVEKFKEDFIFSDIVRTEKEERSMFEWMKCLPLHTFEQRHFEQVGFKENSTQREAAKQAGGKAAARAADQENGQMEEGEQGEQNGQVKSEQSEQVEQVEQNEQMESEQNGQVEGKQGETREKEATT